MGLPTKADLTDLLVAIALLWVLIRIPSWVARSVWQPAQPRMLGQMLKTFVLYRGIGSLMAAKARKTGPARMPHPAHPDQRRATTPTPHHSRRRHHAPRPGRATHHRQPGPTEPSTQPPTPPDRQTTGNSSGTPPGGRPVQLALPIPMSPKASTARPRQLTLPVPATRVPRRAAPTAETATPRVRSRQLMFPGMPQRPVPHRQLTLRLDLPKPSKRTKR